MGKKDEKEKEGKEKASKKEKKQAKKQKKKEKKLAKKVKKAAKKADKASRKAELALDGRPAKKKKGSSSSSSSSSSGSSIDLNFVMDQNFSSSGAGMDPRNPDAKIQRALGLTCGNFGFIEREDDAAIAKEVGHVRSRDQEKGAEDRSRDWICTKTKANGETCNARNFVKNETCYACGAMQPKNAPTVLRSKDLKGVKLDGHRYK